MSEQAELLTIAEPLELFDESMLPVRQDLVQMVKDRSFLPIKRPDSARFSGKIVIKQMMNDVELCESVCAALLVGVSVRLIGKRFKLSPHSVVNIRAAMEERGELAAVGRRISAQLDRFAELGLERMIEGVLDGTIHPGQLPIPVLAALDKRAQLAAGVVPGAGKVEVAITLEMVLTEHAAVRAALDLTSNATLAQVVDAQLPTAVCSRMEADEETGAPARNRAGERLIEMPDAVPAAKAGGGGSEFRPPARCPEGTGRKI